MKRRRPSGLSTEAGKVIWSELLRCLPVVARTEPRGDALPHATALHHLTCLLLKAVASFVLLSSSTSSCLSLLADAEATEALLKLAIGDNISNTLATREEREHTAGRLHLCVADAFHKANPPKEEAMTAEMSEWLGKPVSVCTNALKQAAYDCLAAFTDLTSNTQKWASASAATTATKSTCTNGQPFFISTADITTEEFGI